MDIYNINSWIICSTRISILYKYLIYLKVYFFNIFNFSAQIKAAIGTNEQNNQYIAYACWSVAGIFLISTLAIYDRIKLMIAIVKTGA